MAQPTGPINTSRRCDNVMGYSIARSWNVPAHSCNQKIQASKSSWPSESMPHEDDSLKLWPDSLAWSKFCSSLEGFRRKTFLQGSPNMANPNKETYRHSVSVTAWRPGLKGTPFLYTLNLSCPDENWGMYGDLYEQAAATFKLNEPGKVCHCVVLQ